MSTAPTNYLPEHFSRYPGDSRIWLFGLDRDVALIEQELIAEKLNGFVDSWQSHGTPVEGSFVIIEGRFILIIAGNSISGCSTDSLFREIQALTESIRVNLVSPLSVFYRKSEGNIEYASRSKFRELVRAGRISNDTTVFNIALSEFSSFSQGSFELPLQDSIYSSFRAPGEGENIDDNHK